MTYKLEDLAQPVAQNPQVPKKINNSIQSVLLGQFAGFWGSGGTQLSSLATIFSNLRWYLVTQFRNPLSQAYVEIGLVSTVVDVPVDDAMRGGLRIKTKQLDEEEQELLKNTMEREGDLQTAAQAMKWNRLFGGAGIIVNTGDAAYTELKIEDLKQGDPLGFLAADLWELNGEASDRGSTNSALDEIKASHFTYYGNRLHRSRIMILKGIEAPSLIRPRLRGFGLSICEKLISSINQYLKSNNLSFEVLDEFKIDIFKIKDLNASTLNPEAEAAMQQRLQTANMQKNYMHALTMDIEDDYAQKQLSFAGLAEVMEGIRVQVASDLRIPLSKLFGTGSTGFSSGQDDIENYNSMIESEVRSKIKFDLLKMVELRCQVLFGYVPTDLMIEFYPLRVLTAEQEEAVKTAKATRIAQFRGIGLMSVKEAKEAINKGQLLDVQIEVNDELEEIAGDAAGETSDRSLAVGDRTKGRNPKEPKEPKE